MQAFRIDRSSPIPVKLQFKAQVRYQVAAGLLYPGDQLPSLRDLAEGLSINLNTVVRAVDELTAEGYLHSHQGKGVFVADEPPGGVPGPALRSLLAGTLASAQEWAMGPGELALAVLAQSQLARSPQAARARVLLVGTARADLRPLQRGLEAALPGVAALPTLPEELGALPPGTRVAATLFHTPMLAQHRVISLAAPDARAALAGLADLQPGSLVAIVAGDWVQAGRIRQSLERGGFGHLRFGLAASRGDLEPLLVEAAALLAAQSGRELAEEARAIRPDLPCVVEPLTLIPEAIAALRLSLGTTSQAPRVAVRSSWV